MITNDALLITKMTINDAELMPTNDYNFMITNDSK